MNQHADPWRDPRVAVAELPQPRYPEDEGATIRRALDRSGELLGWADADAGPLGTVIPSGARVVVKPNWVYHENHGPWGIAPLLTHDSLIRAVVESVLETDAAEVLVADAPLQSCDFDRLAEATRLHAWVEPLMAADPRFRGVRDLRRTVSVVEDGVRTAFEDRLPEDEFVLFDLGEHSLLEPITAGDEAFRVTRYDPRLLAERHRPGRHQYLIGRAIVDADVVINLPKLKTHKKAGITCALKNLIGINGNKEFLPHHRIGGSETGGDCYRGGSRAKLALEHAFDRLNMAPSPARALVWHRLARAIGKVAEITSGDAEIEGAWIGNDTIWRTCLDLNRVLLYGRADGMLGDEPQRRVIHIVDAVIAGQGDGPLAPQPLPLGYLLAAGNAASIDHVGAMLLGYDPTLLPIAHHAFDSFEWPITAFGPDQIRLVGELGEGEPGAVLKDRVVDVTHPDGWRPARSTPELAAS